VDVVGLQIVKPVPVDEVGVDGHAGRGAVRQVAIEEFRAVANEVFDRQRALRPAAANS